MVFYSVILKAKFGIQDTISPYSFEKNLNFKHSVDKEIKMSKQFDS